MKEADFLSVSRGQEAQSLSSLPRYSSLYLGEQSRQRPSVVVQNHSNTSLHPTQYQLEQRAQMLETTLAFT